MVECYDYTFKIYFLSIYVLIFNSLSRSYIDDTFKSAVEINVCRSSQSSVILLEWKSTGKDAGFSVILHDKLMNLESNQRTIGPASLT